MSTAAPSRARRRHCITVAVEDYFHVSAFHGLIHPRQWSRFETSVERNTLRTLELLEQGGVKATFFTLGWVAERVPELIRGIAERGHEVASKGYHHRSVDDMSPEEFREDLLRGREAIEGATGMKVHGHRVARGSIGLRTLWALDILAQEGFAYDSSIYPRLGSIASQPWRRFAHEHRSGDRTIWEMPLSSWPVGPWFVPAAGGAYMRHAPDFVMRRLVRYWDRHHDAPFVMYFHVWELDRELPRIQSAGPLTRLRQYRNPDKMRWVLPRYFKELRFGSIADYLGLQPVRVRAAPERRRPELALAAPAGPVEAAASVAAAERPRVTIVVPCYNEELVLPYLANTVAELAADFARLYEVQFVFVDDGSSDETWHSLQRIFGGRADCKLVRHAENRGVAAAILTGIGAADSEIACSIDCDCTYDPRQLLDMIPRLGPGVDLVTASPYHREGAVENVPAWRLTLSKGLSSLYRLVLRQKLATYTSCFRVYRRSAVEGLVVKHSGFLGVAEILGRMDLAGRRIVEHPAVLEVRMLGRSKMKILKTILGHLKLLCELAAARLRQRSHAVATDRSWSAS